LTTQAIIEISTDESQAYSLKWINLIFCLKPKSEEERLIERKKKKEREKER